MHFFQIYKTLFFPPLLDITLDLTFYFLCLSGFPKLLLYNLKIQASTSWRSDFFPLWITTVQLEQASLPGFLLLFKCTFHTKHSGTQNPPVS